VEEQFFKDVATEAEDYAADIRARILALEDPPMKDIFAHVFTEDHPVITQERQWLENYTASFDEGA
jgi:pyruvate dehydrogenase E1 component alpha subunit